MTDSNTRNIKLECAQLLLQPVVRFCIRNGQSYQDLVALAKVAFVRVADDELKKATSKINVSRISALTGICRDDVRKIFRKNEITYGKPLSLIARVMGQWQQDKRFTTGNGQPRSLTCQGEGSEFYQLVEVVSKHLNPGTVLFELERLGTIERSVSKVKLLRQALPPGTDPRRGYEIMAKDIDNFITASEENLSGKPEVSNLHLRTEYDNIFVKNLPEIRQWLINEGKIFHRKIRDFLSQFDQDITPSEKPVSNAGGYVVVTSTSLTSPLQNATEKESPAQSDS